MTATIAMKTKSNSHISRSSIPFLRLDTALNAHSGATTQACPAAVSSPLPPLGHFYFNPNFNSDFNFNFNFKAYKFEASNILQHIVNIQLQ